MFQQLVQHGRAYKIAKTIVVNEYEVDQRDHLPGKKLRQLSTVSISQHVFDTSGSSTPVRKIDCLCNYSS